jgi:hypothetical protein
MIKDDRQKKQQPVSSPYAVFTKERYASGDMRGIKVVEGAKLLAQEWKGLSEEEKKVCLSCAPMMLSFTDFGAEICNPCVGGPPTELKRDVSAPWGNGCPGSKSLKRRTLLWLFSRRQGSKSKPRVRATICIPTLFLPTSHIYFSLVYLCCRGAYRCTIFLGMGARKSGLWRLFFHRLGWYPFSYGKRCVL